ncbi:MAG TPA: DUF1122 family protein [Dehalococcoidia bacterium]|nr:DUF1122 family protein [Dehalococcoidia bacterium]
MGAAGGQWGKAEGGLAQLEGQPLGTYHLGVLQGPRNPFGAVYFQVRATGDGQEAPALVGLFSRGTYPAHNWIEVLEFYPGELAKEGLLLPLFRYLSALVPPGGHMMVEYESPSWASTREALALGVPPVLTPLGHLLRQIGCERVRDWNIAEGGREGRRKLIGYKAFNAQTSSRRRKELESELQEFLARPRGQHPLEEEARRRARQILENPP